MTKISNQRAYIPDEEINGLDYLPGTDFDQALKTVNFRVQDLGTHYNQVNGVRNFDYNFYAHSGSNPKPADGYFYSNSNEKDPNNITHFIFSKKTARLKDTTNFFESIATENPFDLIIAQKVDINTIFFFRIDSIETFSGYYKLNVSEVFFPNSKELSYTLSNAVFNLKSEGISIHNQLNGLNEGDFIHLTATEKTKFDNLPETFPTVPTKTSDLLNDGADGTDTYVEYDELEDLILKKQNLPTGFITGLDLTINALDNTKVDISPGAYVVSDFTDLNNIQVVIKVIDDPIVGITPQYLNTGNISYIALDINKNIVQSSSPFTEEDRRTLCIIGAAIHSNLTNVNVVNEIKAPIVAPTNQLHDLMRAIGSFNLEGNIYSPNGGTLELNKTSGVVFGLGINANNYLNPHQLTIPNQTGLTFRYRLQNGFEYSDTTSINPTNYDLNGVLTPLLNNNKWQIQRINLFQSGMTRIQPGQHEYNSLEDAEAAIKIESFVTETNIAENAIFRSYLIVKKNATDLSNPAQAKFIPVDKFGNVITGNTALTYTTIIAALGFTPEDSANKATNFTVVNHTLYPTVEAVEDRIALIPSGSGSYTVIGKNVVNSSAVTGTTAQTTVETFVIPANTFQVGDIGILRARIIKTGTNAVVNHRHRITTNLNFFFQTNNAVNIFSEIERRFVVKSATVTQEIGSSTSILNTSVQTTTINDVNIDWTVNQDLELRLNNGSTADSSVVSYWELSRIR
jgi:hypothetical protein